jgi:hypothetical protein
MAALLRRHARAAIAQSRQGHGRAAPAWMILRDTDTSIAATPAINGWQTTTNLRGQSLSRGVCAPKARVAEPTDRDRKRIVRCREAFAFPSDRH